MEDRYIQKVTTGGKSISKAIASVFGIGYIKGGASIASAVTCAGIWLSWQSAALNTPWYLPLAIALVTLLGIAVSNRTEADWGKTAAG